MKTREANELYEKADTQSLFPIFLPLDWTNKLDEEDPEDDDWTAYSGSYLPSDWIVLFVVVVKSTPLKITKGRRIGNGIESIGRNLSNFLFYFHRGSEPHHWTWQWEF